MRLCRGIFFTWKMFATLLAFVLVIAHASEIPSYIHPCSRKDSNYDQCVKENINDVKTKLCIGLPEFNIGSKEPILINKIVIYDTNNLKLHIRDIKIYEFCNFVINSVQTDPSRLHFKLDGILKNVRMDTLYDFDIRVLVPLANKGRASLRSNDIEFKINLDLKEAIKNGKTEIYASKVNSNFFIKKFTYELDESEKELAQLHQALGHVIETNQQDIINNVKPVLEEKISQLIISVFNDICRSNYEKLFPK